MSQYAVVAMVAVLVLLLVASELVSALLPLLLILILVPASERRDLAEVLAAADNSPRLRLWPALRAAVSARRHARRSEFDGGGRQQRGHRQNA